MTVNTVGTGTTGQSAAQTSSNVFGKDFQTFLTLLTKQLQYQDPLAPMDTTQFTQQLVSFTAVEQQISTNSNLEKIISQLSSQDSAGAIGYIGKEVAVSTASSSLKNGEAKWTYALDLQADTNKLVVKNSSGTVVYETNGEIKAGIHQFSWDGKSANGDTLPDGLYTLEVQAKTANGTEISNEVYMRGRVEAVERVSGESYLSVNGLLLKPTDVQSVFGDAVTEPTT